MLVSQFDYHLPTELIAQEPVEPRHASRLLVLERVSGRIVDTRFSQIGEWLRNGDLLVLNDTKVIPARVYGRLKTGGRLEFLLLGEIGPGVWEVLTRPARKARPGTVVDFGTHQAEVLERRSDGMRLVRFEPCDVRELLSQQGQVALPPYIKKRCTNPERYQTVYAAKEGAVAAPTAGLHFTTDLLEELSQHGVEIAWITLHAALGTFRPVTVERVEEHTMHPERFELSPETATKVNRARDEGRRVVCCGTTTVRVLESQAEKTPQGWRVQPGQGRTNLFIYPGYEWKITGALLTNFHLPRSTLLMLVCAFAGTDQVFATYHHAIEQRYRFYSFGDAMLIV
ncbi:MAG: tRNA preQ1(34) S-adenosylmethionine ribosyltransferase-isomerase QueA [candidate division WOR-3 bacterium]